MAVFAQCRGVLAAKGKAGLRRMIEVRGFPGGGVVTLFTPGPECPFVRVGFLMAGIAIHRQSYFRCRLGMAVLAANLDVLSKKREFRRLMIKSPHHPIGRGVAAGAFLPQARRMYVVGAMTGNARGRNVSVALIGVTIHALASDMRAR